MEVAGVEPASEIAGNGRLRACPRDLMSVRMRPGRGAAHANPFRTDFAHPSNRGLGWAIPLSDACTAPAGAGRADVAAN